MGVLRTELDFETQFVRVPNEWVRDRRLSRKARGLLVELMSHQVGWHITVASLVASGSEGEDAVRAGMRELIEFGYLRRSQKQDKSGKFKGVEYELGVPEKTQVGTASGLSATGLPGRGKSGTKKTNKKEDHIEEDLLTVPASDRQGHLGEPVGCPAKARLEVTFKEFWDVYPRKVGKAAALRAFRKALKQVDAQVILEGARRFAEDPNLPQKQFIPHPATWLNRGSWDDEPLPQREQPSQPVESSPDEWMDWRES